MSETPSQHTNIPERPGCPVHPGADSVWAGRWLCAACFRDGFKTDEMRANIARVIGPIREIIGDDDVAIAWVHEPYADPDHNAGDLPQ